VRLLPCVLLLAAVTSAVPAFAQDDIESGLKPFGSYHGGDIDSISNVNSRLFIAAPLSSYPQRGPLLSVDTAIQYNNSGYRYKQRCTRDAGCWFVREWEGRCKSACLTLMAKPGLLRESVCYRESVHGYNARRCQPPNG